VKMDRHTKLKTMICKESSLILLAQDGNVSLASPGIFPVGSNPASEAGASDYPSSSASFSRNSSASRTQ
jgi:hypothetical protein